MKSKGKTKDDLALERIEILFNLAKKEFREGREDLADRYVLIARKIAMKINLPMDNKFKNQFCKKCGSFLVTGTNATRRIVRGVLTNICHKCGNKRKLVIK